MWRTNAGVMYLLIVTIKFTFARTESISMKTDQLGPIWLIPCCISTECNQEKIYSGATFTAIMFASSKLNNNHDKKLIVYWIQLSIPLYNETAIETTGYALPIQSTLNYFYLHSVPLIVSVLYSSIYAEQFFDENRTHTWRARETLQLEYFSIIFRRNRTSKSHKFGRRATHRKIIW